MKLKKIHKLVGKIILKSGLHIGSGDTEVHIGGIDNPVVKTTNTSMPYIPGSSLKGKIRSLLELYFGLINFTKGEPVSLKTLNYDNELSGDDIIKIKNILKLFGYGASDIEGNKEIIEELLTTRLIFQDCYINKQWLKDNPNAIFTETKAENSINRQTSKANPRFIERVPEGIEFDFGLSIKEFDIDEQNFENMKEILKKGFKLLELDYLGGNGSRGCGKIEFDRLSLDGIDFDIKDVEI